MSKQASIIHPSDPRPYLTIAKSILSQTNFLRHCKLIHAVAHAPITPISKNKQEFESQIRRVQELNPKKVSVLDTIISKGKKIFSISESKNFEGNELQIVTSPDSPEYLIDEATIISKSNPQKAAELVQKALAQFPNNPLFLALFAQLTFNIGQYSTSAENINKALDIWQNEPRWHHLAAKSNLALQNHDASEYHLKIAIELEPDYEPHYQQLAQTYLDKNEAEKALPILNKLLKKSESNDNLTLISKTLASLGKFTQAKLYAEKLLKHDHKQAHPYILNAQIALASNKPLETITLIEKALKLEPNNTNAILLISKAFCQLGKPDEALTHLEKAIQSSSNAYQIILEQTNIIKESKGIKSSLENLSSHIKQHPNSIPLLKSYFHLLIEDGKSNEAIRVAQHSLKTNPPDLDPKTKAEFHFQLGTLLRNSGQLDQAIYHLNKSVSIAPGFDKSYIELGQAHLQRRQHDKALHYLQTAISINPTHPIAYEKAGLILKECKDYHAAESMFRKAANLEPSNINIQRQLGAIIALNLVHTQN